ncbi:hypothetical protein VKI21_16705 [Cyanobacterium aponinum UTEX 3222]|uniref:Uncharacterized protein n=3 Tax=Cyanobacterium aponinum TaxID=379064 RepID=K9Z4F0_CYAAP|nr:hypothetical protein [Cyanobacterium aponinum]WRL41665.1 hypothetical protein VKI21_16705 [Cyanobacterium aponinum UTEX 3222]AFZ53465.1 hypothetical protein Cyan10605_1351 [Cyanobacterium aponinum PCC 10605]MBD2393334.1 hypothetical protein [Cyanobacterium aponinum FACHB-4101]MTF38531.1 hypothetical protein [Cyanobacterium aponinum 0216]PHV61083.1 hypothetical protein CSQ80_17465 [Cyanobacterium aponinum IPPAS B-1201]
MWFFHWEINIAIITGSFLWCLALYLGFAQLREMVIDGLYRWFNFAERFLYTSEAEFERTRKGRESQNAFLASLMSVIPFLILGLLCNWLVEIGLGRNWSISVGILAVICCAVYDLGRRDSN